MTLQAALVLGLLAAACSTPAGPGHAVLDKPFDVKVGETVVLPAEALRITLLEVRNDSRCPVDVVCVWQGDAEIVLQVETRPEDREEILLGYSSRPSATFDGYTIERRDLAPPTRAGVPIDPKAYVVTLVVSRLQR